MRLDPNGLPIHGLLAAFPFPHDLRVEAELAVDTLTVATTVVATGDVGVPVCFGWHPYLRLPGVPREEWTVELAVKTRALLDERGIPTGSEERAEVSPGPLGTRGTTISSRSSPSRRASRSREAAGESRSS